ncbi:hypothetical protein GUITHDRAFT_137864 [Guillardia theta CCMP2712]|uniref:Chitin-binding type-4 domain-containing protein n=1 Tax=Guillardia theta (strain CCMP2712) TaxID=905079 RepID=L1JFF8_GUITC|nr:hypothetical protein GUITHDRAFT_137864 [Guillardia theta CCMP2712]EKX46869.1 hypothetical protein GUITHDRAFT_137864 [Guillardia theta CCMP2712]|eukprot:XP_005833849.1 hypothetical protein GUITHDRAFT_137864 [Guillardia theta CCMP2712]
MRCWPSSGLAAVILTCLLGTCQGQTYRFCEIEWKTCYRSNTKDFTGGFYDPLFPSVCERARSDPRSIGVSLHCSWAILSDDTTIMLQTVATDVQTYNNTGGAVKDLRQGLKAPSQLYKGSLSGDGPQRYRRIGWYYGLGDATYMPGLELAQGFVSCPVSPCSAGANDFYIFQITRISEPQAQSSTNPFDRRVFARYSFQVDFPSGGDYTVYFEGCCRQQAEGAVATNGDYLVQNNPLWPFHVRAAVTVPSTGSVPLYKSSIRWNMPDVTVLRSASPQTENSACASTICLSSSCYRSFTLQAYHQEASYPIYYRLGTIREMGAYKCYSGTAPPSVLQRYDSARCTLTEVQATSTSSLPVRIRGDQFDFDVNREGTFQVTVVAYTYISGKEMGVAVDFLVKVLAPGTSNWHAPKFAFPLTTTNVNSVQIQCGENQWIFNSTTPTFKVYFQNDVNTKPAECIETGQRLRYIAPSTDLPKGVSYTQHVESNLNYIEIAWRPQCEDLSQVGLFQFCFEAEDTVDVGSAASFKALRSSPSCFFVYSRPPLPNPSPSFISPTKYLDCSETCCECCGLENCACTNNKCCNREFAKAGTLYQFPVHAHDNYLPEALNVKFTVAGPTLDKYPRDVYPPVGKSNKYSCGDSSYDTCTSSYTATSGRNDVLNALEWDLMKMYPFKCANSSLQCSGPSDTSCPNAAPCIESSSTNFVGPLKVCYQVTEQLRVGVDGALWLQTYGIPPNNDTCKICFSLAIASSPFFLESSQLFQSRVGLSDHCVLNATWTHIISNLHLPSVSAVPRNLSFITGGLGASMVTNVWEVWVCQFGHACIWELGVAVSVADISGKQAEAVCFVYDEMRKSFLTWGLLSELGLAGA